MNLNSISFIFGKSQLGRKGKVMIFVLEGYTQEKTASSDTDERIDPRSFGEKRSSTLRKILTFANFGMHES